MTSEKIFNLAGSIVTVALVTTVLMRGSAASQLVRAFGDTFSGALATAMGNRS